MLLCFFSLAFLNNFITYLKFVKYSLDKAAKQGKKAEGKRMLVTSDNLRTGKLVAYI